MTIRLLKSIIIFTRACFYLKLDLNLIMGGLYIRTVPFNYNFIFTCVSTRGTTQYVFLVEVTCLPISSLPPRDETWHLHTTRHGISTRRGFL